MGPTRHVVLCADDYGLTEGVSRGILELAGRGRLSATSAMTNMPHWPRLAKDLAAVRGMLAAGLHVNLTTGSPVGRMPSLAATGAFPPLRELLARALAGRLDAGEVQAEIERQLDAFEQAFGERPAFIDGHQHVQVIPGIRGALLNALKRRSYPAQTWLRDPADGFVPILRRKVSPQKALVVKALAAGFGARVRDAGFSANEGFSGFSPLDLSVSAERVLRQAFVALGPHPVVMCHPGHLDDALKGLDPATDSRPQELAYLGSSAFGTFLSERSIVLCASLNKNGA